MTTRTPAHDPAELGRWLRQLRQAAGLTLVQAAQTLECSPSKLSRIERGQTLANPRDVRELAALYRVPAAQRNRLLAAARTVWTSRHHQRRWPDQASAR
jgi:transcriptional regulator with XRE-family HTH domain